MSTAHILLVDSDFETKQKMVILLFSNGYEVLPVTNIKQATKVLRIIDFDLILCSSHLPDGDGQHLLHTVKSAPNLLNIPFIALTASAGEAVRDGLLKSGAAACIQKTEATNHVLDLAGRFIKEPAGKKRGQTDTGISGQLSRLTITDLIVKLVENHSSGDIHIDGSQPMAIFIRKGNIVHSRYGITVGKKALFRCLRIADAAFDFQATETPVEQSVEGSVEQLMEEARQTNQKLMANFHKLPNPNYRARIVNWDSLERANLRAEARAAIALIRKYPRIGTYIDRLNLPDVVCYEYLLTFLERGDIELVTESKPVKIFTDSSCDLPAAFMQELGISTVPLQLQLGKDHFATASQAEMGGLYTKKTKVLEQAQIGLPQDDSLLPRYMQWVGTHDCLSIFMANEGSGLFDKMQSAVNQFQNSQAGRKLLANEITIFNSHSVSLGLALLVQYAANLAKQNKQIEKIEEKLIEAIDRLHVFFAVVPDRSVLVKKGNAPVILYWNGGEFTVSERLPRGGEPISALISQIRMRLEPKSSLSCLAGHVANAKGGAVLQAELSKQLSLPKTGLLEINPLTGYLLGQGALGVAFFQI